MSADTRFLGRWTVADATAALRNRPPPAVAELMTAIDAGRSTGDDLVATGGPAITVELFATGSMAMQIVQSLRPGLPGVMTISAPIAWEVEGELMQTQAQPAGLTVQITLDADADPAAAQQAATMQAGALAGMKADPLWSRRNTVVIRHVGPRCFLTQSVQGQLMLHRRTPTNSQI